MLKAIESRPSVGRLNCEVRESMIVQFRMLMYAGRKLAMLSRFVQEINKKR